MERKFKKVTIGGLSGFECPHCGYRFIPRTVKTNPKECPHCKRYFLVTQPRTPRTKKEV